MQISKGTRHHDCKGLHNVECEDREGGRDLQGARQVRPGGGGGDHIWRVRRHNQSRCGRHEPPRQVHPPGPQGDIEHISHGHDDHRKGVQVSLERDSLSPAQSLSADGLPTIPSPGVPW